VLVVLTCIALVALGAAMVVRWSTLPLPAGAGAPVSWQRWLSRWAAVALSAGLVAGLLAAGAGGRLVMRLLAATSSESTGQLTEAEAVIGTITLDGSIGFILFAGLPFGLASGLIYLAIGRVLPGGWAGGALFGLLLLVLAATRVDPLRSDNFDFNLLGPSWLAVGAFVVLALFHAMLLVAVARRLSLAWLPSPAPPLPERWRAWGRTAARVAVAAASLIALPGFVAAVAELL
jgi:hypothetical protein